MPSLAHEALVEIVRTHPEVTLDLLRALDVEVPPHRRVTVTEAALGQLTPTQAQADVVVELVDEAGAPRLVIVHEVQLGVDRDKLHAWPGYAVNARVRRRCDACVLVFAPDPSVAAWASRPIRIGPGNPHFRVLVVGPAHIPVVTDPTAAAARPALAVLSALAHANDPDGRAVLDAVAVALETFDRSTAAVYHHLIYASLAEPLRRALEAEQMLNVKDYPEPNFTPWLRSMLHSYRDRGLAEGKLEGKLEALLQILRLRGVALTDEQRAHVAACADEARLDLWTERALRVTTADELLA